MRGSRSSMPGGPRSNRRVPAGARPPNRLRERWLDAERQTILRELDDAQGGKAIPGNCADALDRPSLARRAGEAAKLRNEIQQARSGDALLQLKDVMPGRVGNPGEFRAAVEAARQAKLVSGAEWVGTDTAEYGALQQASADNLATMCRAATQFDVAVNRKMRDDWTRVVAKLEEDSRPLIDLRDLVAQAAARGESLPPTCSISSIACSKPVA